MKISNILHFLSAFFLIFILASCNKKIPADMQDPSASNPAFKTFNYTDAVLDTAMVFIEEVVNHDEGNAAHVFTDMVIDSVAYSFTVSVIQINGVPGLPAAEQQRIKDSVLEKTRAWPARTDTTLLNDFDLIFTDISDWQLNGNTLTFWGNSGIGSMDPAFIDFDCQAPQTYNNEQWDWKTEAPPAMEKRLNAGLIQCRPMQSCSNNSRPYYKEITTKTFYPINYPSNPDPSENQSDNYMDYWLYHNNVNLNPLGKLNQTEMIYHTDKMNLLGISNAPASQLLIGSKVHPIEIYESATEWYFEHWMESFYGISVCP